MTGPDRRARAARARAGDYSGEQFMQWFIKEQVEEVSSMSACCASWSARATSRCGIEEYLAREAVGEEAADPGAAGGRRRAVARAGFSASQSWFSGCGRLPLCG